MLLLLFRCRFGVFCVTIIIPHYQDGPRGNQSLLHRKSFPHSQILITATLKKKKKIKRDISNLFSVFSTFPACSTSAGSAPVCQLRGGGKQATACAGIQSCGQAQMLRRANQANIAAQSRGESGEGGTLPGNQKEQMNRCFQRPALREVRGGAPACISWNTPTWEKW